VTEPNKTRGVAAEYFCKLSEFYAPIYIAAPSRAARLRFFFKSYPYSFFMGTKEQQRIKVFMPARMMNSRAFKFAAAALFLSLSLSRSLTHSRFLSYFFCARERLQNTADDARRFEHANSTPRIL
jgi:hypothetical protein